MALLYAELLEVVFSGIIVTKSGGVSRARDLAHSRPHIDRNRKQKSAIKAFGQRLAKFAPVISALPDHVPHADIMQCSARNLAIEDVFGPPDRNISALMPTRSTTCEHEFSLVWLGTPVADLGRHRSKYIGSETTAILLPGYCLPTQKICSIVSNPTGEKRPC